MNKLGWPAAMRVGAVVGLVGMLTPSLASADIYAWVDSDGSVTYGNLPPPKNARVFEVIKDTPPSPEAEAAAQAAHRSEMQALNARVQQLEQELQQSRYQAMPPPPPAYPMPPPSYGSAASYGPPPDYAAAPSYGTCDSDFYDCSTWASPIYYTVGVAPFWGFRPRHDFDHFHHGRFVHPGGGPHFNGGRHFASAPHFSGGTHFASAPHFSGGYGHASSHSSGSMGHSR
jgi:Domain of unknown function (DUF4124)